MANSERRTTNSRLIIGVLALQGDFDAHRRRLEELGAEVVLVRKADDFDRIDGLVIPGGESTTFLKLLPPNLFEKLKDFVHTKPTFGTCAGAIMLAKHVTKPDQRGLDALDMIVERNAYGRQIDSTILEAKTKLGDEPLEMVFIRAPRIQQVGDGVEILAERDGYPVLVRKGSVMAATFHPELSDDPRVHAEFLKLVKNDKK